MVHQHSHAQIWHSKATPRGQEQVTTIHRRHDIGTARQPQGAKTESQSSLTMSASCLSELPCSASVMYETLAEQGNSDRQDALIVISLVHSYGNPKGQKMSHKPSVSLAQQGNSERQDSLTVISLMHSHCNPKGPRMRCNSDFHCREARLTRSHQSHAQPWQLWAL